jgi:hypothetical protein
MKNKKIKEFRIHGDNILECETALRMVAAVINPQHPVAIFKRSAVYAPIYRISDKNGYIFELQLFPGYGRWNIDIAEYLSKKGAPLREATDALITRLVSKGEAVYEIPVLALEFCGALPAGNNAWQRCGRALALAYAKIPYLYFAEIGGVELDSDRNIKAPRFPNPLVPFAYLTLGEVEETLSLPVYLPSPSMNKELGELFADYFGHEDSRILIRNILLGEKKSNEKLRWKAERIVEKLAEERRNNDSLSPNEWTELAGKKGGIEKAEWLITKKMPWAKKTGMAGLTASFKKLLTTMIKIGAVAAGSKDMPLCLLDKSKRSLFAKKLKGIYKNRLDSKFMSWISNQSRPLVCVWIAGFKPRGDDSRPDRGLTPLARMIFGRDVDLVVIVYGPAKPQALGQLQTNMEGLAKSNGLWESIINLSNALIIDTKTSRKLNSIGFITKRTIRRIKDISLPVSSTMPNFGEHDVDSVLHAVFSESSSDGVYESMCNPPGGDWSGISIIDFKTKIEYRWTSLPRVSGDKSKRPDHLVQFKFNDSFLSIESKEKYSALEKKIGPRLEKYARDLIIEKPPISYRRSKDKSWETFSDSLSKNNHVFFSGAAFIFSNDNDMKRALVDSKVDVVIGVEFIANSIETRLHLLTSKEGSVFVGFVKKKISKFPGSLSLEIH